MIISYEENFLRSGRNDHDEKNTFDGKNILWRKKTCLRIKTIFFCLRKNTEKTRPGLSDAIKCLAYTPREIEE